LPRHFFERYTPTVARELLGARLVRVEGKTKMSGVIVETEAYRGRRDPASHAFRGRTLRNQAMFGSAGHAYVYFTMGVHYCLNVTTEGHGIPGAVLIRAIEPREGLELMRRNRGLDDVRRLAAGPGNLTKALAIGREFYGEDMTRSRRLFIEKGQSVGATGVSTRVGVSSGRSFRWRFFAKDNPYVSRGKPSG